MSLSRWWHIINSANNNNWRHSCSNCRMRLTQQTMFNGERCTMASLFRLRKQRTSKPLFRRPTALICDSQLAKYSLAVNYKPWFDENISACWNPSFLLYFRPRKSSPPFYTKMFTACRQKNIQITNNNPSHQRQKSVHEPIVTSDRLCPLLCKHLIDNRSQTWFFFSHHFHN